MVFDVSDNISGICVALNLNVIIIWSVPIDKELKPSKACGYGLWGQSHHYKINGSIGKYCNNVYLPPIPVCALN